MSRVRRHRILLAAAAVAAAGTTAVAAPRSAQPFEREDGADGAPNSLRVLQARDDGPVSPAVAAAAGRLIVKFDDDVPARTEARVLRAAEARVDEQIDALDTTVVAVPPRDVPIAKASLEASPHVEYVERDAVVRAAAAIPNDTLWRTQWGLQLLDLPQIWQVASARNRVLVAVVDSGIDAAHPDLAGVVEPGIDLVNGDADATDDNGHGTAAAGVIAAVAGNGIGGVGICRTCSVIPVKVLDGNGAGTTSMLAEGIVWAADRGARVISMSLGSPTPTDAVRHAVAYAAAKGAVLIAAAGNAGTTFPFYPAADAGVVSVGATMADDSLYEWSNRGPWVRLAAPGCNTAPGLGGGFVDFCGTSSAAPVVAGLAGVAIAESPAASPAAVEAALGAEAVPVPYVARGRVNARGALAALGIAVQPEPRPVPLAVRFVRSSLSARTPVRRFPQPIGKGRIRVVVRTSTPRTTLTLLKAGGRVVARAGGRRVLALARTLPAGTYRIAVRGPAGTRFTASITYPRTPKEASLWLARTRT